MTVDWSDHGLWWPQKNIWLSRFRNTLDQYGVQADALLHFTPTHKILRIQLPDLRYIDTKVDLSIQCFSAVKEVCKDLGIRHPEELSFCRPLSSDHLKRNYRLVGATSRQRGMSITTSQQQQQQQNNPQQQQSTATLQSPYHSRTTDVVDSSYVTSIATPDGKSTPNLIDEHRTSTPAGSPWTRPASNGSSGKLIHTTASPYSNTSGNRKNGASSPFVGPTSIGNPYEINPYSDSYVTEPYVPNVPNLAVTPAVLPGETKATLLHPRNLIERARLNAGWLDSSLSLYEQDVREFDLLLLRFKFFTFYDINPKLDAARINEIYEQAKWSILTEEIECTEMEMLMFAGLVLQVNLQAGNPNDDSNTNSHDDDIDAALNELQAQLEGEYLGGLGSGSGLRRTASGSNYYSSEGGNLIKAQELSDYLRFSKPRRFTLKTTKKLFFVFRETNLTAYKSREERVGEPYFVLNLRGCEITPDVNLSQGRYAVKLEVPSAEGVSEYSLRFNSEEQYAKWLAAFRLASKGKSMSAANYDAEVNQILDFLSIQHPAPAPVPIMSSALLDINPDDYIAPKHLRKGKSRSQTVQRILEAHANVRDLSFTEAKLRFIRAWQALPYFGVSLFVVKFLGSKKEVRKKKPLDRTKDNLANAV